MKSSTFKLTLLTAAILLGTLATPDAQAGHRRGYTNNGCCNTGYSHHRVSRWQPRMVQQRSHGCNSVRSYGSNCSTGYAPPSYHNCCNSNSNVYYGGSSNCGMVANTGCNSICPQSGTTIYAPGASTPDGTYNSVEGSSSSGVPSEPEMAPTPADDVPPPPTPDNDIDDIDSSTESPSDVNFDDSATSAPDKRVIPTVAKASGR